MKKNQRGSVPFDQMNWKLGLWSPAFSLQKQVSTPTMWQLFENTEHSSMTQVLVNRKHFY